MLPWKDPQAVDYLHGALSERIMAIDGAMGTMLQNHRLEEADYRGQRFARSHEAFCLKGNNDLLSLSQPHLVQSIHAAYLDAGADFVSTNTFNATGISQSDYGMQDLVRELNYEGARIAKQACDAQTERTPGRRRFVIGVLGPTNRTASIGPDVNNPAFRNVTFDELRVAYDQAAEALLVGGVDCLMVETVFDVLNAKAAIFAVDELFERLGHRVPLMISGTMTDRSGRTLSGQTTEAFWHSVRHARPFSIGLNCALGASDLKAYIEILAELADCYVSIHPNAGLPNAFGEYDETPEIMAGTLAEFARAGWLNLVGGCCGTTPEHIRAIVQASSTVAPRQLP